MELAIIAVYTIIDDLLILIGHHTDLQAKMSDAEVMTTAILESSFVIQIGLTHYPFSK